MIISPTSLSNSFIDSLSRSWFVEISSRYYLSQTKIAEELKFLDNVQPPPCVTCHLSHTLCQVLHVTGHVSSVTFFYYLFFLFFGQNGRASQKRICYQWGLPRLVLYQLQIYLRWYNGALAWNHSQYKACLTLGVNTKIVVGLP